MLKKYSQQILFFLVTVLTAPLYTAQYIEQDEGKNDSEETLLNQKLSPKYYNYTIKYSKKKIDNSVAPDHLEEEQQSLRDNHVAEKLKNKQSTTFFMVITSNNKTKELNKFFFFNRNPKIETSAIKRAQTLLRCHVITCSKPSLSPHILFQLLGWLAQEEKKYTPIFIHVSTPLCVTCNAIAYNLLNLSIPKSNNGCMGTIPNLEKVCPWAQNYIKSSLMLGLVGEILPRGFKKRYKDILKQVEEDKDRIIAIVKKFSKKRNKRALL